MTAEMTDLIRRIARPEARDLPAYNAGLSSDAVRQRFGLDTIARLGSNENPFGPSPAVGAALRDMADAIGQYPDANSTALRAAIAARTGVEPADIVVGNGSENLLELLCLAFLSPGDRVVTLLPSFGLHEIFPRMMGAQVDMVPVTDSMEFDIDAWCAALGGGARPPRMAILSNPSNPVGCMLDADAFDRVVRAAPPETLLVIDEAYYEYARLTPGFPDVLTRLRAQERPWIVLRTFSKAWGLAGLRVGYGLASHAELVRMLDRVRTPFNVNLAAQRAALAALGDADHMEKAVQETVAQREILRMQRRDLGVAVAPSAANFLFVDLRRANGPVAEALLARGIIVKPWKEAGYEHFIRVSVGAAADNRLFVAALADILRQGA
mgnify:FL=1